MNSLLSNKLFIKAATIFVVLLSVFVLVKGIGEINSAKFKGVENINTITVAGSGEVFAAPDIATIYLNLSKEAKTTKEAQDLLNEEISKTLEYLKEKNIEDKDIKSEYGGISPKYSYETYPCLTYPCPSRDPKIMGYIASQSITVKIREIDNSNEIRTGLAELGIKDISGPTFSIENEDELKTQARELAIKEAKDKAKVLAKQLGVRLGKVNSFYEDNGGVYPMGYGKEEARFDMAVSSAVPAPELPKGENKITSNVTITYEIK